MAMRVLDAALLLVLAGLCARAAEPAIPPMAGINAAQAGERAALFAELKAARTEPDARVIEDKIWSFWRGIADAESRELLEQSRAAQLRFDAEQQLTELLCGEADYA